MAAMSKPKLESPDLERLFLRSGEKRLYRSGDMLFEKGEPAANVGYILQGQARTFCLNTEGDETTLFYIGKGNMICTESLTAHASVIVSVQAISPVKLCLLPGSTFLQLWQKNDWPIQELITHFVRRTTLLSDYLCCVRLQESDKKVAYFLHSCYDPADPVVSYTNEQIATVVGLNRITTNRVLNRFAREGIVRLGYRRVEILQPERLAVMSDGLGYFDA